MNYTIVKKNTIIILDWDDTLFPTYWISKNKINIAQSSTRDKYIVYFQELDRVLSKLLNKLSTYGKIIIVTNALPEWVKISSIVLPNTYLFLKNTKIVSARAKYQKYGSSPMQWKEYAFKYEITNELKKNNFINVISIGDAEYEYRALISLNFIDINKHKLLKSIRFMKYPTHDILIDQLEVLFNVIPEISMNQTHMDLKFDKFSNFNQNK
jgi:hypothetical protein